MKPLTLLLLLLTPFGLMAQDLDPVSQKANDLEAQLAQTRHQTPKGAKVLQDLATLYHANGRTFGLVRSGQAFIKAHPSHPKHADIMVKLIDGLQAASLDDDIVSTSRQFLLKHPKHPEAGRVALDLARLLDKVGKKKSEIAAAWHEVWKRGGAEAPKAGWNAIHRYRDAGGSNVKKAAALASEMVDALPANHLATAVGLRGLSYYRDANDHGSSNTIGLKLLKKKPPMDEEQHFTLFYSLGENYRHLSQHNNAAKVYEECVKRKPTHAEVARKHIQSLYDAQVKATELEGPVNRYIKTFPGDAPYHHTWCRGLLAHAYAREENHAKAAQIAEAILPQATYHHSIAQHYVTWRAKTEKDYAHVERVMQQAAQKNTEDAWRVRYYLGFSLQRDRMKKWDRAQATLLDLVEKNPRNESGVRTAIHELLKHAGEEDKTFNAIADRIAKVARARPDLDIYHYMADWAKDAGRSKDKGLRTRSQYAMDKLGPRPSKDWGIASDRARGMEARERLLKTKLVPEQREKLLAHQAEAWAHHGKTEWRPRSLPYYRELLKLRSKPYPTAARMLELAQYSQESGDHKNAVETILKTTPPHNDYNTFIRVVRSAVKLEDKALAKRAIDWINTCQKTHGIIGGYANEIGDQLRTVGLEAEATAYWQARIHSDPANARHVAWKLFEGIEDPAKRRAFAEPLMKADGDNLLHYAVWIAETHVQEGKWNEFDKVMSDARKRYNARFPRGEWIGESPALNWLEAARKSETLNEAQKRKVYQLVASLPVGNTRATAKLAQTQLQSAGTEPLIKRLSGLHKITLETTDTGHGLFDRCWPYAEAMMRKEAWPEAAALLTGMLNHQKHVDGGRKDRARSAVARCYSRMGSLGLDIAADSPIAPLLEIGLFLRLGDREKALASYQDKQTLFDQHKSEIPTELVLFAANSHIIAGGDDNYNRAEDILRSWIIANSEKENIDATDKADIQLLLGRNYFKGGRYDVARSEFTSVKNTYPDSEQAMDAEFGIGESYMAQKVFDKAEEIFTDLARSRTAKVAIRAEFLRGVLANRRGDREEAREIFRTVLERVPDIDLANETLYNLAEVYGVEQRYMDQLELLRTVGRLGQESKRWHTPGSALSIVVQDSDLGISRGNTRIPVTIRTEPGGDSELAHLSSGGAGKGLFLAEIDTVLGQARPNDDLLQVKGNDTILVDYPDEFKGQFKYQLLADNKIQIAADATFDAQSQKIEVEEANRFSQQIKAEAKPSIADLLQSAKRPTNQIKPGNPIYIRVSDGDRDQSPDQDSVPVKLTTTSGDEVTVDLQEVTPDSGLFEGMVETGELPAGALATDAAIEHNPLMAIDHKEDTYWQSEPDGLTPKSLTIDMKDLHLISSVKLHTPDAEDQAPVRTTLEGSYDGRFWFKLAQHPPRPDFAPLETSYGPMTRRVYITRAAFGNWDQARALLRDGKALSTEVVDELSFQLPPESEHVKKRSHVSAIWTGTFVQRKAGGVRFQVKASHVALMINGELVRPPMRLYGNSGTQIDIHLERGLHDLAIFTHVERPNQQIAVTLARENTNVEKVSVGPFSPADLNLEALDIEDLRQIEHTAKAQAVTSSEKGVTAFSFPPGEYRHVRATFNEYLGEAVAINHVEVTHGDQQIIPPEADVLSLAANDVLELTAGDTAMISYVDEITGGGKQRNRLMTKSLQATYYNGKVEAISYDFLRGGEGNVISLRKDLMRIDPGQRIGIEITDYDLDQTAEKDTLPFHIALGDQTIALEAIETEENSGVFRGEIDTTTIDDTNKTEATTLKVKPGDVVYLRYQDEQNTFPGHSVTRDSQVFVATPTDARIRIVGTSIIPPETEGGKPEISFAGPHQSPDVAGIAYQVPLTVEVFDPDAAKDSLSSITVDLTITGGVKQTITCRISERFGEPTTTPADVTNWPLYEGRFVGQMLMQLGGPESPDKIPYDPERTASMSISSISGTMNELTDEIDFMMPVLNVIGPDLVGARYDDILRPAGTNQVIESHARLKTDGHLALTTANYEDPVSVLHVGEKLFVVVHDPDMDTSSERDPLPVRITSNAGEEETVKLEETLTHSGLFTGSFLLKDQEKPTPGNQSPTLPEIECFFGTTVSVHYVDETTSSGDGSTELILAAPVAVGTDGEVAAFSKVFGDDDLAVQTRFHIAESYFELFKGHLALEREEEANRELEAGRRILNELLEDFPNPKYIPRVSYLLGQFAQELEDWDAAIDAYETIVKSHGDHTLAADAQYKLAQCYEEAGEFDDALENYVMLASTYPQSPLIANVMIRINEYFYKGTNYTVASQVGSKFVERFPDHAFAAKMAFRVGQCHFKSGQLAEAAGDARGRGHYQTAANAFDAFAKQWPDDPLCADGLFWSGEAWRMAGSVPEAFRRYNRCRWDFPESDSAKYARGRLALPEMIAQFEREANLEDE